MTIKDDIKQAAASNKTVKWVLFGLAFAGVIALGIWQKPDEAKQLMAFAIELSQVSETRVVSETVPGDVSGTL